MLSAFAAAKVHCLPSWYELPGLVTLEAARYGCAVVASSWGGIPDYLGDTCYYCQPDDHRSIRAAILTAYEKGRPAGLQQRAEQFTWEKSADITLAQYADVIARRANSKPVSAESLAVPDLFVFVELVTKTMEQGRQREAIAYYNRYRSMYPSLPQLARFDELMGQVSAKVDKSQQTAKP